MPTGSDRAPATALPPHVLQRADMRDALAKHDFGTVFALARKWGGISYSKLAEGCEIKPERVGTLARGVGSITSFEKIAQICDALRIPGRMVGLAPRIWESAPPKIVLAGRMTPPGDGGENVFRRDFLKTAAIGTGIALGMPIEVGAGRRIGASVPGLLRRRAARLRRLDNILGGGDTFAIYKAEYEATKLALKEGSYSEAVGKDLLSVLSEQAQQAGWAAFDAGDQALAKRFYEASKAAAIQAGDPLLAGNSLAFLAYQKIGSDTATAVDLADASCDAIGAATGTAGALLHERRAWAYAAAGNARETEIALERAHVALDNSDGEPGPDWSAWVDHDELQIMAGRCWTELKRPLRAVPILEDVLARFDDAHARDKALYSSWLAESYLIAGEVEASASVAGRVLDLSMGVASVRPRQQIVPVLSRLNEHRHIAAVADVLEKAHS